MCITPRNFEPLQLENDTPTDHPKPIPFNLQKMCQNPYESLFRKIRTLRMRGNEPQGSGLRNETHSLDAAEQPTQGCGSSCLFTGKPLPQGSGSLERNLRPMGSRTLYRSHLGLCPFAHGCQGVPDWPQGLFGVYPWLSLGASPPLCPEEAPQTNHPILPPSHVCVCVSK